MGEVIIREFGIDVYTLLYLKWMTNKDLLYSTRNSAQCYVAARMGGAFGGEWMHVYLWLSSFAVHLNIANGPIQSFVFVAFKCGVCEPCIFLKM